MGLDIYVGSLTRYLAGDWELITQKVARELGHRIEIRREHDPEDAIRDPDMLRPEVEQWRAGISESLASHLNQALDWDEAPETPYFTDKPAWDCYGALMLWAAYEEKRDLVRPIRAVEVEEWGNDPAYIACTDPNYRTRYSHMFDVSLWLPCDFGFTFTTEFLTGTEMTIGSSLQLSRQLDALNHRTWNAKADDIAKWRQDCPEYGAPLENSARFAFSIFNSLAGHSISQRLPMLLDW